MKKITLIIGIVLMLVFLSSCGNNAANPVSPTSTPSAVVSNTPVASSTPLIQSVKFYYPDVIDDKIYYLTKNLTFNENDAVRTVFEKAFKDLPNTKLGKVLSTNTKIKSLYLNKDNAVYVDFSSEFTSEMNAGSGYESMILQCITNTLGEYYGVDKVYLTVEGKPYSSGHILMKKGEFFTVDLKNCFELK